MLAKLKRVLGGGSERDELRRKMAAVPEAIQSRNQGTFERVEVLRAKAEAIEEFDAQLGAIDARLAEATAVINSASQCRNALHNTCPDQSLLDEYRKLSVYCKRDLNSRIEGYTRDIQSRRDALAHVTSWLASARTTQEAAAAIPEAEKKQARIERDIADLESLKAQVTNQKADGLIELDVLAQKIIDA